ncbi:hypothetical protein GGD81_000837 [Rhodobium orientis]|nr:hypothetical protein [Rhodobium orientis]
MTSSPFATPAATRTVPIGTTPTGTTHDMKEPML